MILGRFGGCFGSDSGGGTSIDYDTHDDGGFSVVETTTDADGGLADIDVVANDGAPDPGPAANDN